MVIGSYRRDTCVWEDLASERLEVLLRVAGGDHHPKMSPGDSGSNSSGLWRGPGLRSSRSWHQRSLRSEQVAQELVLLHKARLPGPYPLGRDVFGGIVAYVRASPQSFQR